MNEKSKGWKRVLDVFLDTLFTLVLALTALAAATVWMNRGQVGFASLGVVQSSSMRASGLEVGDAVLARPADDYAVGDVIVFYRAPLRYENYAENVQLQGYPVWIHQVVDVSVDELGRRTYLTKGTSNARDDGYYVPQDFVLGRATKLPAAVSAVVRFVNSVAGIICTVIVPCGIMLVYLTWDLVMLLLTEVEDAPKKAKRKKGYVIDIVPAGNAPEMQTHGFFMRLYTADALTKTYYGELKLRLLRIKGASFVLWQEWEDYVFDGVLLARLDVRGNQVLLQTRAGITYVNDEKGLRKAIAEIDGLKGKGA